MKFNCNFFSRLSKKKKVLLYIPEALFETHYLSMNYMAECLKKQGHVVYMVKCYKQFEFCPPYLWLDDGFTAMDEEKQCANCSKIADRLKNNSNHQFVELNKLLNSSHYQNVKNALEAAPENLLEFTFDSVEFGKLTSYQFALINKVSNFETVSAELRKNWLKLIQTAIISYHHVCEIIDIYSIDNLIYYNYYATEVGAAAAAKYKNVKSSFSASISHRWVDFTRISIGAPNEYYLSVQKWNKWRNIKIDQSEINEVFLDLLFNIFSSGGHRYSPEKDYTSSIDFDLCKSLNIPKSKKILTAYTSSDDERLGMSNMFNALGFDSLQEERECFYDQLDWLSSIIKFVSESEEYFLIIRIHPRSGKNKFNSLISEFYVHFLDLISNLSLENCLIIHPHENVSSYDLIELSSVCLVSWSSIGLDIARMGIPCISAIKLVPTYPDDDFLYYEKNKEDYFNRIEELCNSNFSIKSVVLSYRWYIFQRFSSSIYFENIKPIFESHDKVKIRENKKTLETLEKVIIGNENVRDINLTNKLIKKDSIKEFYEEEYLNSIMMLLLHVAMTGEKIENINQLDILNQLDLKMFSQRDGVLTYNYSNCIYSRYSPFYCKLLSYLKLVFQ